jgi:hypothetical protein
MNAKIIENIKLFLARADIKWSEVPAFVECMNSLQELKEHLQKELIKTEKKL